MSGLQARDHMLRVAAEVAVGDCPPGGPYELKIRRDMRTFASDKKAYISIDLKSFEDGSAKTRLGAKIPLLQWRDIVEGVVRDGKLGSHVEPAASTGTPDV